jgi:hypothetical protein
MATVRNFSDKDAGLAASLGSRLDDGLQLAAGWYLELRDWHFALYWRALVEPSRRAVLATVEQQRGEDRAHWEVVALSAAIRDFRVLAFVVAPLAVPLGGIIAWLLDATNPESVQAGLVAGPMVATFVVGKLQIWRFQRGVRPR